MRQVSYAVFEQRAYENWLKDKESGETDLDYGEYLDNEVQAHNDMLENS